MFNVSMLLALKPDQPRIWAAATGKHNDQRRRFMIFVGGWYAATWLGATPLQARESQSIPEDLRWILCTFWGFKGDNYMIIPSHNWVRGMFPPPHPPRICATGYDKMIRLWVQHKVLSVPKHGIFYLPQRTEYKAPSCSVWRVIDRRA